MKKSAAALLVGAGVGAAMYFLDPQQGVRRRALMQNRAARMRHRVQEAVQTTSSDLRNRAQGYRASLQSRFDKTAPSDSVLQERVRAAVGRCVSNPGAIEVTAANSIVTLTGPVLYDEVPLLIDRVYNVRGVQDVINRLQVNREPGNVPSLQGTESRRAKYAGANWSPATRFIAGTTGLAAGAYGFAGPGLLRKVIALGGVGLLARAASNTEFRQLARFGRGIEIRKSIEINAPIERVFQTWTQSENFPHFMSHVVEVRRLDGATGGDRWHWKVKGTSGMEFEFDSRTTAIEQNRLIAWRSESGAWVHHTGSVRFTPTQSGSTNVEVRMSYKPVAGAVGHVIAKMLGDDPKKQMDDDLLRMKSFIESGTPPHDAAAAITKPTSTGSRPSLS